jgi:hypothetical protein
MNWISPKDRLPKNDKAIVFVTKESPDTWYKGRRVCGSVGPPIWYSDEDEYLDGFGDDEILYWAEVESPGRKWVTVQKWLRIEANAEGKIEAKVRDNPDSEWSSWDEDD